LTTQPELFNTIPELNKITVGDCIELLSELPPNSIDAMVTDPPFAITGGLSSGMTSRNDDQFFTFWFSAVIEQVIRVLKPDGCGFIWCDWRSESAIIKAFAKASERYDPWWVSQVLYHDREMVGMGKPFRNQVERILFFRGRKFQNTRIPNTQPNIIRSYWYYGKHKWHDAEKSPEVAEMLIKWASDEGETIIDPFCGSGTIPISCKQTGRNFVAYEIDEGIAGIANERMLQNNGTQGNCALRQGALNI
jgi:site-specific DNA-methyltransferase (adenine-specific)